ncbi:Tumor necrosis factor TNF-alpha [Collichthys lucidus]|uniref:Lymphotoxin-alpha n=1 Tax=Collichthys lucidus TaxID=240159 RepID=A0A4U5TVL0_COLLU|nr:Tumor necrosis factor TNF-alpha [Collichthys lucidus]
MEGECKVQLDATVDTEAGKQTTQRFSSKLTTALLTFTLCLAAVLAAAAIIGSTRQAKVETQEEDNSDVHRTLRQISNTRAAIHLGGVYNPELTTSVEWENQVDQSYSQGGLKLVNNEIVIPRDGLYFIYSQASFSVSCSSSDDDSDPMVHLSHTVKRSSNTYGHKNTYETILHSVRTACQKTASNDPDEDGNWFSTIYMGAVFSLNAGDKLKTVMEESMLKNLEDDSGKTFFGVFAL